VILFTKRREANIGIAKQFSSHTLTKAYQALSWHTGKTNPPQQWTVKNFLGRVSQVGKKTQFGSVRAGGDSAETNFQVLQQAGRFFWIQAQPKTGRTHQIRVHLSEGGLPILGDTLYGGCQQKRVHVSRLMLHAACLTFQHPIHQNEISVKCALPGDFNQCLRSLQSLESAHF
jgi:23S rRNA-/tRNA-specific pseudouridylate synthase